MSNISPGRPASQLKIFGYAFGDGAVSIVMNGIASFAMLYYTQILGLSAVYAGLALSIAMFWDAITYPIMGYFTDMTKSRFGRRVPYMVAGGLFLAPAFFLLWFLPLQFATPLAIFFCILAANILTRTALTIFVVPYTALGFEICPDYTDRSKLQGARYFVNQIANLIFGAMAWTMFFKDGVGRDGNRIDGSSIAGNYLVMGAVLAAAIPLLITVCIVSVRRNIIDNRRDETGLSANQKLSSSIGSILKDRLAWYVFGFLGFALLGMMLTAQVQMFTFVFYMKFTAVEKSCVHGGGMLAFALASLALPLFVKRLDKKLTAYLGMGMSAFGGVALFAVFTGGLMVPGTQFCVWGYQIPLAVLAFGMLQAFWWGGCGIIVPLATSMIADISEINNLKSGALKDGGYASVLSFFMKTASSIGLMLTGGLVTFSGIVSKADTQTIEAARNISILTFLCGPVILVFSFLILRKYPVNRAYMEAVHRELENRSATKEVPAQ